jgi:putative glutamate/gamma-aminobutyrate antiporter
MVALINVCAICNIKNFPLLAEYGLAVILYLILSALFFFVPVSLVSAELASGWPDRGVYTWVKEGLGPRWGFLAIWLQWIENVIWYPTILSFIAATFAYILNPDLATNKTYVFIMVLATFWPMTLVNFFGMRVSGWISSISALLGTIVPIALIILLGGWWIFSSHPSQIAFTWKGLVPDLTSINQLVLISGVLLGLAGMEMSAVHARDVENPRRNYPRAILLSTLLILFFSIFGSLAISAIVPEKEIELASGAMEAFKSLFDTLGISWATPVVAAIMTFGALGMMSTWIVGPSRGMLATAEHGDLPPIFHKTNAHGMPTHILIAQAIIVTLLSFVFLFMPSVSSSYWILVALSAILYMVMYILMFLAAIRLRYTQPHIERTYRVPCLWLVSLIGIFGAGFGFVLGFFPPSQLDTGSLIRFESFLMGGTALFCLLPFCIYKIRKPSWKKIS